MITILAVLGLAAAVPAGYKGLRLVREGDDEAAIIVVAIGCLLALISSIGLINLQ